MIVQTASAGQPHFVITQVEHARMSGQFAHAFGNDRFTPLHPKELMEYVVAHHDEGWEETDKAPARDPHTDLPYQFTRTPMPDYVKTGSRSPDFNERQHAFCGLLSSMHTWGLYHGRYGLSDTRFIDAVAAEHKPLVQAMLQGELERQARLTASLAADGATAAWVDERHIIHNYKLLQFFDGLALYFNVAHEVARRESSFKHVPRAAGDDADIVIRPLRPGFYALTPYPFAEDFLEVDCEGRYLLPLLPEEDLAAVLRDTPTDRQACTLVAGT